MKRGPRTLICTLAGMALCTSASAAGDDASGNPYQSIVIRNVFGLKPPPPPPDPEANKPPPPKIWLTGITTILGNKRALLKATPPPKPGEQAKEQSFTLAEGQREGDIEVLEINEKERTVKVNDYGTITTLDFEKDGVKVAGIPPAPGAPGVPPRPAGFPPAATPGSFAPGGGANVVPRPMRLPNQGASVSPAAGGATPAYASAASAYGGGAPALMGGSPNVPYAGTTTVQPQPQAAYGGTPQLTAEQQFLMVEAERLRLQQSGQAKMYPPIPPTPLSSELNSGAGGSSAGATTPTSPALPPRAPSLPPLLPTQKSF